MRSDRSERQLLLEFNTVVLAGWYRHIEKNARDVQHVQRPYLRSEKASRNEFQKHQEAPSHLWYTNKQDE